VLFRGRVDFVGTSRTERHRGGIVLEWLPHPTLRTWVRGATSELAVDAIMGSAHVAIGLDRQRRPCLPEPVG
jgi:hypothetical protein